MECADVRMGQDCLHVMRCYGSAHDKVHTRRLDCMVETETLLAAWAAEGGFLLRNCRRLM